MITVELSEIEAGRFKRFQECYSAFGILYDAGVFDLKGATAVIDKDISGKIKAIHFDRVSRYPFHS